MRCSSALLRHTTPALRHSSHSNVRSLSTPRLYSTSGEDSALLENRDLHAAWASLAAYTSDAIGPQLDRQAARAKNKLENVGYQLETEFVVEGGTALSFDGTREVQVSKELMRGQISYEYTHAIISLLCRSNNTMLYTLIIMKIEKRNVSISPPLSSL